MLTAMTEGQVGVLCHQAHVTAGLQVWSPNVSSAKGARDVPVPTVGEEGSICQIRIRTSQKGFTEEVSFDLGLEEVGFVQVQLG